MKTKTLKVPHWEVHAFIHRDPDHPSWEISVIRSDNHHGHISYGWFDDTKLLVSCNGNHPDVKLSKCLETKLRKVAQEYADELNAAN